MSYENIWRMDAYDETARFMREKEMMDLLGKQELSSRETGVSGIPLVKKGNGVYVDNGDGHTIVVGESGSGKTRKCVIPAIVSHAYARRSMIICDVKGELSSNRKVNGLLQNLGYVERRVDFRTFAGDGVNVFTGAFRAFKDGEANSAGRMMNAVISALINMYGENNSDRFWGSMSAQHLMGCAMFLMNLFAMNRGFEKYMNMGTLACFTDEHGTQVLENIVEKYLGDVENNYTQMLRNVFSSPERTKSSIVATSASVMRDFMVQEDLLNMLCSSSFDIEDIYEQPTVVYVIIPDEVSTYDTICGFLFDTFYERLVSCHAKRYTEYPAKCQVEWICDEFCNLRINDMKAKISASRSRQMRWMLICQSKKQLESVYRNDADVIIGNCRNTIFLQSSDMDMLKYISQLCGTTRVSSEGEEPLASVEMLRRLKKERTYKEAVYIADNVRYVADLIDYDCYECLEPYADCRLAKRKTAYEKARLYTPMMLAKDLNSGRVRLPWK